MRRRPRQPDPSVVAASPTRRRRARPEEKGTDERGARRSWPRDHIERGARGTREARGRGLQRAPGTEARDVQVAERRDAIDRVYGRRAAQAPGDDGPLEREGYRGREAGGGRALRVASGHLDGERVVHDEDGRGIAGKNEIRRGRRWRRWRRWRRRRWRRRRRRRRRRRWR